MSDKIYYDRDDLDEDEQKLFDEMVLEEMAKLENQFLDSSVDDERRDHNLPVLQLDSLHDDMGRDNRVQSSPYTRNNPPTVSYRSQQQHSDYTASMSVNDVAKHSHSEDQRTQRPSRVSMDAENYLPSNGKKDNRQSSNSPEFVSADVRQASQEYKLSSNCESQSATRGVDNSARRTRRGDHSPISRGESTLSQIGANDPSMVSPSQKRAQQAKYAFELADANAKSEQVRALNQKRVNGDVGHGAKSRRTPSAEVSIQDSNIISSIGQDDQQLKERRKMMQLEYAQQLSNQQHQRHHQNTSPIVSPSKIIRDASPSSSRGNYRDNYGDSTSASSKSGLVNFGTDPDVEAEKKREMKAAYGRQLQDQQSRAYDSRSYSSETDRSDARTDGYRPSPQQASYDSREEDRNAAVSAAELKRFQQRQYHDEITNAAAAAPINSARTSLRGNSQSRQSPDDGYHPNGPGTGLPMGGNSSSFLTSADAERLESRSKKVQLQQMYAKQLSDDATLSGARTSRNHSIAGVAPGSVPGSRRGSSDRQGVPLDSRDYVRPSSGTANGPGGGIFESMSEKDQLFAAAAKKKASQAEYYQQLQDADRRRSDPPQSSRVPLNRREQREDEAAAGRSSYGSRHSSRPGSDYSQRDQSEISGYAGQGYSSGAGPGSSHSRHTADGDLNTARRRQQEDYARALREDAQAAPIAESYSSRRRSNYDAEDYGGRNGGSGVSSSEKFQGNFSEKEEKDYEPVRYGRELTQEQGRYQTGEEDRYQERQSERYMEREPERRRQSGDDRYQEREQSGYQERASERGSGYNPSVGPPHNHGPSYDRSEEQSGMGTSRRSPRGDVPQGRQREGAYGGNISPDKEYDSRRAEEYSPPPSDQSRSRRNSEDIKKQYLFGSNSEGRSRQGGGEGGYIPESNYSNGNGMSQRSALTPPTHGRGRSSGGGASSISLYG